MQTIQQAEFTNKHGDKVDIVLMQDSAGGYHLIVKAKRVRVEKHIRFNGGKQVELETRAIAKETSHTNIEDEWMALNEFHLERYMNSDPAFGMTEYRQWQIANEPKGE